MIEKILKIGRKIIPKRIFKLGQPLYHFMLALTGNIFYRFPGKKLVCIGVTGTNGKSTTVELINSVLKEAGYKTGMLSTIALEVAGERAENITSRTTLGRWQTPKLLRKMVKAGCKFAIIEVASEGIVQFRTWGIPFDVAVFTNLTPEHLNTHGTMTRYRNTKGKLFINMATSKKKKNSPKVSVVNIDDRESGYFGAFPADRHYNYSLKKGDFRASDLRDVGGLSFEVNYQGKKHPISSKLVGDFNVYNILAAWAVGHSQGVSPKVISAGIARVEQVKGRMDRVAQKNKVSYYVDYAVTPESFELLFKALKKESKGRLIAVFGATGDRDKKKRPKLGEVAGRLTDVAIITDEEPYSEDPEKIIKEVAKGAKKVNMAEVITVSDRKDALKKAISMARPGDIVVATGMGHQKYRNVGGSTKIPWDEGEVIKSLL
jgi:UDP-N-acetylmuramoyl-L-alanyl-D-glutamate--2,6-diaminopimelate ligase